MGSIIDPKAEKLAAEARDSLSEFCYTECLAYCCRRGYLLLSEAEVSLMQVNKDDLHQMPCSGDDAIKYIFHLGKNEGCPNLIDHKCSIHTNSQRPKACRDFPVFLFEKKVIVSEECPAVDQNRLYPILAEFKKIGYEIVIRGGEDL
jgi:Fe-S-cluster containining protein